MGGAVSLDAGDGRGATFELVIAVESPARVLEESRARQQHDVHPTAAGATVRPARRREGPDVAHVLLREGSLLLLTMRDGLERGDVAAVERAAHTLKRTASLIGAAPVVNGCTDLINVLHADAPADAAAPLARIERAMAGLPITPSASAPEATSALAAGSAE
jgi:hypothetical protein